LGKQQVLLVEPEATTRRQLRVCLEQAGYAVTTAADGIGALSRLERSVPALVLSATDLPEIDGYTLVRRMKERPDWASIPVIFMLVGKSIEDKIRGLELGVEDYLSKPVFAKELIARVQVLLAKRVQQHLSSGTQHTRVHGKLADLPTIDLLESLESGEQTGVVRIFWGASVGEIVFQDGEIVDATLKRLRGEEVVFRLLCWTEGTFEVEVRDVSAERTIELSTRALIEAGIHHASEFNQLLEQLPSVGCILEVDQTALATRMSKVPPELESIVALLDGDRTVWDIIDDSPFDDISTLQTVSKLYAEGLLRDVLADELADERNGSPQISSAPLTWTPLAGEADDEPSSQDAASGPVSDDEARREPSFDPPSSDEPSSDEPSSDEAPFDDPFSEDEATDEPPFEDEATDEPPFDEPLGDEAPPTPRRGGVEAAPLRAFDRKGTMLQGTPGAVVTHEPDAPVTPEGYRAPTGTVDAAGAESHPFSSGDQAAPRPPFSSKLSDRPPSTGRSSSNDRPSDSDSAPPTDRSAGSDSPAASDRSAGSDSPAASDRLPKRRRSDEAASSSSRRRRKKVKAKRSERTPAQDPLPPSSDPASEPSARTPDHQPSSDPRKLSSSGVSDGFFASSTVDEQHEEIAESVREIVYLTDEQLLRKRRGKRIVAVTVGVLVALTLFVWARGRDDDSTHTSKPSASSAAIPSAATTSATAAPASTTTALAAGSSATAAPAGEGGNKGDGGGDTAPDAGPGGQGGGEALPDVDDPLKEAEKLNNMGRYKDAVPMAKAAIKKDPSSGDAYFWLGIAYESMGKRDEAKKAYGQCAKLEASPRWLGHCKANAPR